MTWFRPEIRARAAQARGVRKVRIVTIPTVIGSSLLYDYVFGRTVFTVYTTQPGILRTCPSRLRPTTFLSATASLPKCTMQWCISSVAINSPATKSSDGASLTIPTPLGAHLRLGFVHGLPLSWASRPPYASSFQR
jgi:hypothetical protein